jgi:hypothetical protein
MRVPAPLGGLNAGSCDGVPVEGVEPNEGDVLVTGAGGGATDVLVRPDFGAVLNELREPVVEELPG